MVVVHNKAPEPLVWRKAEVVCDDGQVYVWPAKVVVPEILAVPPTSSRVLVMAPALMPRLPVVISKPVEEEAPPEKEVKPVKALADVPVWV